MRVYACACICMCTRTPIPLKHAATHTATHTAPHTVTHTATHTHNVGAEPFHAIETDTTEEISYLPTGWSWGDGAA